MILEKTLFGSGSACRIWGKNSVVRGRRPLLRVHHQKEGKGRLSPKRRRKGNPDSKKQGDGRAAQNIWKTETLKTSKQFFFDLGHLLDSCFATFSADVHLRFQNDFLTNLQNFVLLLGGMCFRHARRAVQFLLSSLLCDTTGDVLCVPQTSSERASRTQARCCCSDCFATPLIVWLCGPSIAFAAPAVRTFLSLPCTNLQQLARMAEPVPSSCLLATKTCLSCLSTSSSLYMLLQL